MLNNRVSDERRGVRDASPAPRLLLLDQDPWCRALADGALRAQSYRVVCSGDIDTAARVAREMSPDLVVVDVGVPVLEEVPVGQRRNTDRALAEPFPLVSPGYCILRPLELEPSGARRPVVMLRQDAGGGEGGRPTRFAILGYVAKPFTPYTLIRHLESHVGRLRARAQAGRMPAQPTNGNAPPAAFEGSVEALGVPAVLEILHFNQLSGVCVFEAPGGRRAEVEFQSGEVIGARTADGAQGADAIFRLVTWTDGRFVFNIRSFGEDVRTLLRFEQMMLEGMRRLDEGRTFPFEMMMGVTTRIGSS